MTLFSDTPEYRRLPAAVRDTLVPNDPLDPVARQYLPAPDEGLVRPEEHPDPIGDDTYTPVKGIVHRYPDRVLLKITASCAVYCRFCFRKESVGPGNGRLSGEDIENAIDYIKKREEIWEVILTGGDPLTLSASKIRDILQKLSSISHVQVLRIHTRVPIVRPEIISEVYVSALQTQKPLYVSVHVNHVQEITREVEAALERLHRAGCVLISQSVLLKGVNDTPQALEALFRKLVTLRVRPYYLHHCDLAPGTSHFRTSLEKGQALMQSLRGAVSGLCQPHYVLDIPGGAGKVNAGPCSVRKSPSGQWLAKDRMGTDHPYPDTGTDL